MELAAEERKSAGLELKYEQKIQQAEQLSADRLDYLVSLAASDDRLAGLLSALAVSDDQLSRLLATNASTAMIGTHGRAEMAAEREVEREARKSAAGIHDRAKMAAEREVERETRQFNASAELETCGGTGGQPHLSVGAVTGAGVRPVPQVMDVAMAAAPTAAASMAAEPMAAVPRAAPRAAASMAAPRAAAMETAPMGSAPTAAASMVAEPMAAVPRAAPGQQRRW